MTTQGTRRHYTVSNTTTEELLKYYRTLPRKKNVIAKELERRGVSF
jgi:hypothetical protein